MARVLDLVKAFLFFLAAYLAIGVVWYVVEETISPLAASAVSCLLPPPAYWLGSRICLRPPWMVGAFLLGVLWSVSALVLDLILWVEPLGILSGPLAIEFSAEEFYMERYFPYLLVVYGEMFGTPILYAWIRGRKAPGEARSTAHSR